MLDQAFFDADKYLEGGWVDSLAYEWQILEELEQRQKVKEGDSLKQVISYSVACEGSGKVLTQSPLVLVSCIRLHRCLRMADPGRAGAAPEGQGGSQPQAGAPPIPGAHRGMTPFSASTPGLLVSRTQW